MTALTRPEVLGDYIAKHNATIRETARVFNISKSTVHIDVSKKLKKINLMLYKQVKTILDINFKEKNIRGGNATKKKYELLKKQNRC